MPAAPALPLTLLVIARDEAPIIGRRLDSAALPAEKLVLGAGRTDGPQAVCAQHGARVVHQDWLGFGPQRNFGSTHASRDRILALRAGATGWRGRGRGTERR